MSEWNETDALDRLRAEWGDAVIRVDEWAGEWAGSEIEWIVDLGSGWAMPWAATVSTSTEVEDSSGPQQLVVIATVELWRSTRRLEVVSLELRPARDAASGVRATMLRQVPVAGLVAEQARRLLSRYEIDDSGHVTAWRQLPGPDDVGPDPTVEALAQVAGLYKAAAVAGYPPVKFLSARLGFGRPKAADWVKRARYAGLIEDDWLQ